MFRGMDMNGNKMSGEMNGQNMSVETADKTQSGEKSGKEMSRKKKFPIGWLVPVAALTFFLGHFWSYVPVIRGIVSLFVISKFCGTQFVL